MNFRLEIFEERSTELEGGIHPVHGQRKEKYG